MSANASTNEAPDSNQIRIRAFLSSHSESTSDTPEADSFFGDYDTSLSPVSVDAETKPQVYSQDPGEINIHQFYPILEHSFSRKQIVKEDRSLLAIEEEDSKFDHSADELAEETDEQSDDNEDVENDEDAAFDQEPTDPTENQVDAEKQEGVFTTAVDEESIKAAILRSQGLFTGGGYREKEQSVGLCELVNEKANEHFQNSLDKDRDPVRVIASLNKAISLKPDDPVFYAQRAEVYIKLCDFQSGILNYRKACQLDQQNQEYYNRLALTYYFKGQALFDLGLYEQAMSSFTKASDMVPGNVGYHIRSITCLAALNRHSECLALVNTRLETDRNNPDLYVLRARLHKLFRNSTLCFYDVKNALNLDPDHTEGRAMMDAMVMQANSNKAEAMQLNIAGKHREALQRISIAIDINPTVADYHVLRGALYRKLNDFNSAIDEFLMALDKADHNEDDPVYTKSQRQLLLTYNDFAVECFTKGFYDEAIILLNKAIKGEKNEKSLYVNRGDCFYKQNELSFALEDYDQALELDPQDSAIKTRIAAIHNEFGSNFLQDKNYTEAEAEFTLAIQNKPHEGQYYISRARTRYMLDNTTGAKEDLLHGLLLAPSSEELMSMMTRLFPGKSVADIMSSPAALAVKNSHSNLSGPAGTENSEMQSLAFVPSHSEPVKKAEKQTWQPTDVGVIYSMCMEEKEFYVQQVNEKKKVEHKVKDALRNRKSLRYNGARLQPLPPPLPKLLSRQNPDQQKLIPLSTHAKKKSSTNWRTFSLGVGGV
ncbi:tetratricopeptide repeat protein 16-like [Physella acuta]|uniref:tetratricopeptide repeat protein 16-like n=1 Tax=Physella acuta TaxID=109671 RepID=UPI0027DBA830|nr:tetratricopeptide repeat protein 16-like [Physella acuta]